MMADFAVIPARGGSKRIPRKNIKPFLGRPMLVRAIATAQDSGLFDRIIVSSDDDEILALAEQTGALPLQRPARLADDHTPTVPVIAHAIEMSAQATPSDVAVCCIYPCVPFLQANDLRAARELLRAYPDRYAFPVAEFASAPLRALSRTPEGELAPYFSENVETRSQDVAASYHDAGQFYWAFSHTWRSRLPVHTNGVGVIVPRWRAIDIDTPEDWAMAELIHSALQSKAPE